MGLDLFWTLPRTYVRCHPPVRLHPTSQLEVNRVDQTVLEFVVWCQRFFEPTRLRGWEIFCCAHEVVYGRV